MQTQQPICILHSINILCGRTVKREKKASSVSLWLCFLSEISNLAIGGFCEWCLLKIGFFEACLSST